MRDALKDVIVGIEAREDGSFWLLVGEGPPPPASLRSPYPR